MKYLFLCVYVDYFSDVKQMTIKGRQPMASLNVKPLQLRFRFINGRVKKFPFRFLGEQEKQNYEKHSQLPPCELLSHKLRSENLGVLYRTFFFLANRDFSHSNQPPSDTYEISTNKSHFIVVIDWKQR